MNQTFELIKKLAAEGKVKVSEHGYDELADDDLTVVEILAALEKAEIIEDYPDYPKGPCVLVLQWGSRGQPIHAVWGVPAGKSEPAVLVTAYCPDPQRWEEGFKRRRL